MFIFAGKFPFSANAVVQRLPLKLAVVGLTSYLNAFLFMNILLESGLYEKFNSIDFTLNRRLQLVIGKLNLVAPNGK